MMALQFQLQQFPFALGLSEGTDPHQVPPGTLTTAENVVWKQSGRLEKRPGYTTLATTKLAGGNIAAASRIFTRGSELCLTDGSDLFTYTPALTSWRNVGKVPALGITSEVLVDPVSGVSSTDSAQSGATRIDAWVTGTGGASTTGAMFVQVVDTGSGAVILSPKLVVASGCSGVRVMIVDGVGILLTRSSTSDFKAATVSLTTLAVSSATTILTNGVMVDGAIGWDACVIGTTFVVAYSTVGPVVSLESFSNALVAVASGSIASEVNGASAIAIDGASGEVLYVTYADNQIAKLLRLATADPATLTEVTAPVTLETGGAGVTINRVSVCRYDATHCVVSAAVGAAVGAVNAVRTTTYYAGSTAVVAASATRGTWHTAALSKPFMFAGKCWQVLSEYPYDASSPYVINTYLAEVEVEAVSSTYQPHRMVGAVDILIGGWSQFASPLASACLASATRATVSTLFQSSTSTSVVRQGIRVLALTSGASAPQDLWRSVTSGHDCFFGGGIVTAYDGRSAFDYGFQRAPFLVSLAASNGAGTMALGSYLYAGHQEYRSATGLLYRGPIATGTQTLTGANDTITVTFDGVNSGNKQTEATGFGTATATPTLLAWYRSVVNGTVYQRLTVEPTANTTYVDQSIGAGTFTDLRPDSATGGGTLASRPALYTTGGVLDDYAPPANVTMFSHVARLFVLAHDQRTWWYSKSFQDDLGVAPGFHPDFRIIFEETQTAGAPMDDKAIFFSASGVSYMPGTGPSPAGLSSDFATPIKVQTDVGCTSARSVVSMPDGIMFQSARGLYLLTRGLELVWVGRPVKDTFDAYPVVTSAVLVAKHNQVRFTCTNAAGTAGIVLVFDYVQKQWATRKYTVDTVYGGVIADACIWNGAWTFVSSAGTVHVESESTWLDGATWVPVTIETAWISAAGPLAFHSVRQLALHGRSHSDHDLTVSVGFDSDTSYPQSITIAAQSGPTTIGVEECAVTIGTRRKCQTIRFKFTDATPTTGAVSTGQGLALDMMGIEVGLKRGLPTTPATKKG